MLDGFNRIVRRFSDDLEHGDYRVISVLLKRSMLAIRRRGLQVRDDPARLWEHAHVLLHCRRLLAAGSKLVDFGGGNSILCYELAREGYYVVVLDVDEDACAQIERNGALLGLSSHVRALQVGECEPWPLVDSAIDAVVSTSVFEALAPRARARFFGECRRVLRHGGELLMTFDFGHGAALVGDPVTSTEELCSELVGPSGLELVEPLPQVPAFGASEPFPLLLAMPAPNGYDFEPAGYTVGALRLRATRVGPLYDPPDRPRLVCRTENLRTCFETALDHAIAAGAIGSAQSLQVSIDLVDVDDGPWTYVLSAMSAQRSSLPLAKSRAVLEASTDALRALLTGRLSFWQLYYSGEIQPRGELRWLMRLFDALPELQLDPDHHGVA